MQNETEEKKERPANWAIEQIEKEKYVLCTYECVGVCMCITLSIFDMTT